MPESQLIIGLMSGTSLDGVDGVLAAFSSSDNAPAHIDTVATAYLPFPPVLRKELMRLQAPGDNEIHREALVANQLAELYAECVDKLLSETSVDPTQVRAVGVHGQTIRHRPELGYTRQTNNPALIAELCGVDVIADFRSRDIAAGGQGAPLVPAFHQAVFGNSDTVRVIANIGGISNISVLGCDGDILGFDTGPGNVLMDAWVAEHRGVAYDANGLWASGGNVVYALLADMQAEPYLAVAPPKSTGRDLFHRAWLAQKLAGFPNLNAQDVQATLATFTATTLADAIAQNARNALEVYVCGGGAYNAHLMQLLQQALGERNHPGLVHSTDILGVSPNHVEALAFAWLAYRHINREAGNLSAVTGAKGSRVLGALYPK
ncbi:anhydro-N-acetylmuramic acid kinase [Noviherbaspirillum saxi]|uniref:Anhydro-N-acetylmuramic acid kinase n=1 Tax=Noviherbaspirillum saxi TaxID=2320863 RepID=A0A3A3FW89_9BURK|nr:anhydro-N-acetylmuramic acid kinase [Noviherbaspirillum saxi]RJF99594.1 anhydro-N-acetylmuramic acid kinase [Noviherbaspirillum saxi]